MPEKVTKNSSGGYSVTGPHGVHAKNTTKEKAEAQARLLNAIDHGFEPNRKGNFSSRSEATDEMMQTIQNERDRMPVEERSIGNPAAGSARGQRGHGHSDRGSSMGSWHDKRSKL